jgi:hypothetical protein
MTGKQSVAASLLLAVLVTGFDVSGNSKRVFGLTCSCSEAKRRVPGMPF